MDKYNLNLEDILIVSKIDNTLLSVNKNYIKYTGRTFSEDIESYFSVFSKNKKDITFDINPEYKTCYVDMFTLEDYRLEIVYRLNSIMDLVRIMTNQNIIKTVNIFDKHVKRNKYYSYTNGLNSVVIYDIVIVCSRNDHLIIGKTDIELEDNKTGFLNLELKNVLDSDKDNIKISEKEWETSYRQNILSWDYYEEEMEELKGMKNDSCEGINLFDEDGLNKTNSLIENRARHKITKTIEKKYNEFKRIDTKSLKDIYMKEVPFKLKKILMDAAISSNYFTLSVNKGE